MIEVYALLISYSFQPLTFGGPLQTARARYVAGGSMRTAVLLPVNDHYNAAANAVVAGQFFDLLEARD